MKSSNKLILKHENALKKDIFFTKEKWPHFNLLFNDIKKLANSKKKLKVLIIERSFLYGKLSLLAPFFKNHNVVSIDCTPKKLVSRGSYNKHLTINPDIIKFQSNFHFDYKKINLNNKNFDLIIIPNLIHHIADHVLLFKKVKSLLKRKGKLYIFEPLLREMHQKPEDYVRFTPFGLEELLKKNKFNNFKIKNEGGVFTSIIYCWDQAFQYLPKKIRIKEKKNFFKKEFQKLLNFESLYKKNLVRKNTSFPVSFSITCNKN